MRTAGVATTSRTVAVKRLGQREAKPDTMAVTERDACAPDPSGLCAGTLRVASSSRCRPVAPLLERTCLPTKSTYRRRQYLLECSSGRKIGVRMHAKRPIEKREPTHDAHDVKRTTCCIVGGGPAGCVLALLLARRGVNVTLLEAHLHFDREFRGDTIHPSVMEIMDQLGLAE